MIHLYAEHLLNIHTLSIQASLSTVSNKETKATLSADGSILTLTHNGEGGSITLPFNLSPNKQSNVILTIPAVPSRELTFRIQLEEKEGAANDSPSSIDPSEHGNVVPWTANSLSRETELYCKSCGTILVERGIVREWKDLPSEGWAEMMDFWHCHKPDEADQHDHANSKKGYSASSRLALSNGVGMIDTMNFLLAAKDCKNITINSDSKEPTGTQLLCSSCNVPVGQQDVATDDIQLRKLQLSISTSISDRPAAFDVEKWLACLLLNAMENQGVRKFIVQQSGSISNSALKLWIFSPDLSVSSSVKSSSQYIRMAKILWQDCNASSNCETKTLNGSTLSEGELKLHHGELGLLRSKLERSSALLPQDARVFQDWNVGLLERFTLRDIELT